MMITVEAIYENGVLKPDKPLPLKEQHPATLQGLSRFQNAVDSILHSHIQVLTISPPLVGTAARLSRQFGLLTNDALIVAVMQDQGLTNIASLDADFDRVSGLTRYAPV